MGQTLASFVINLMWKRKVTFMIQSVFFAEALIYTLANVFSHQ